MTSPFKLIPNPTFTAVVEIPRAGEEAPGLLSFTFHHYGLVEYQKWLGEHQRELESLASDVDGLPLMVKGIQHIAKGWALDDEFNAENITALLTNYGRAYASITATYFAELMGIRAKN